MCDDFSSREPPAGAHHLAHDLPSALRLVDTELAQWADQVWVIGGSSLYQVLQNSPALTGRSSTCLILVGLCCGGAPTTLELPIPPGNV